MNQLPKNLKSILAGSIMIFLITSGLFAMPRPANAQWATFDSGNIIENILGDIYNYGSKLLQGKLVYKEYLLDGIAWAAAKGNIKGMTGDMVNIVASGHTNPDGTTGPGFVTNLKNFTRKVGDRAAKKSIASIRNNKQPGATAYDKSVASSTANKVQKKYYKNTAQTGFWSTHKETLSKVVKNPTAFFNGDFAEGGWDGWNAIDSNVNNNPYFVQQAAQASLKKSVAVAQTNKKTELGWGQGFLPKTACTKGKTSKTKGKTTKTKGTTTCKTQTPGSVIKAQLNKTLGASVSSLVSADEFDEIIGSLAMGLVSKVVGGGSSGGLLGVVKSGALSKYRNEPPPGLVNMVPIAKAQIKKEEKELTEYLGNLQTVLDATKNARTALKQLIAYTPPTTASTTTAASTTASSTCTATLNKDVAAAKNALSKVQSMVSSVAIANATSTLAKLETIGAQLQSTTTDTTALQNAMSQFQQLQMPSAAEIVSAQSVAASTSSGVSSGPLQSGSAPGLIVSGGSLKSRMSLITKNASTALANIKKCFSGT